MHKKIASILRKTGNLACLEKARNLENDSFQISTLNLRNLCLPANDIIAIAKVLEQEKDTAVLKSISFSYNNLMGDIGATVLARSLPSSLHELGLVDCGISDKGGRELLHWIQTAPNLNMICIEQNKFSKQLKIEFELFKQHNPQILVVI